MDIEKYYTDNLGIDPAVVDFISMAHKDIKSVFEVLDENCDYHQARILESFRELRVSQRHFNPTSGYGYGDEGRDNLDMLYAKIFGSEDALVRTQWVSGTHVLSDSLFALLRPGDTLLSITGQPYDTLHDVIGINQNSKNGSLMDWGVKYKCIDLKADDEIDIKGVEEILRSNKVKLVFIQRSRGYNWRQSLPVLHLERVISMVKSVSPDTFVMVDNCYGEFTEAKEPTQLGADLVVGSLIKNPGGGLAPTGAYAAGSSDCIELLSQRLTSPGIGREVGSFPYGYTSIYQGLFMAPHIVCQAMKGAVLASRVFELVGYTVLPKWNSDRSDIIQSIRFNRAEELISFCQAVQSASPVDGYVVPEPWDMPGYSHQVIMAAGTFVQGASIELSSDAPIKEPYTAYLQGGLTYSHVKTALMKILDRMKRDGYINF